MARRGLARQLCPGRTTARSRAAPRRLIRCSTPRRMPRLALPGRLGLRRPLTLRLHPRQRSRPCPASRRSQARRRPARPCRRSVRSRRSRSAALCSRHATENRPARIRSPRRPSSLRPAGWCSLRWCPWLRCPSRSCRPPVRWRPPRATRIRRSRLWRRSQQRRFQPRRRQAWRTSRPSQQHRHLHPSQAARLRRQSVRGGGRSTFLVGSLRSLSAFGLPRVRSGPSVRRARCRRAARPVERATRVARRRSAATRTAVA